MTEQEQTMRFADGLDNLVALYRKEYDLSYASAVGVLQMKIHLLCDEAAELEDED